MKNHCTDSPIGRLRRWCLSCGSHVVGILFKNLMFYLSICFNQQKGLCIKSATSISTSGSTRVTGLSFAKFWINVLIVLTFNIFQSKLLTCIVCNIKIVKPGTQPVQLSLASSINLTSYIPILLKEEK